MRDKYIAEITEMLQLCDDNTLDLLFQIIVKKLEIGEHTL